MAGRAFEAGSRVDRQMFVSYSRRDENIVADLILALNDLGVPTWSDAKRLRAGDQWRNEIAMAIDRSLGVLVVCSSKGVAARWSEQESEILIVRDVLARRQMLVVPVRLDECEMPPMPINAQGKLLDDLERVDLFKNFNRSVSRIALAFEGFKAG